MARFGYIENGILFATDFNDNDIPANFKPVDEVDLAQTQTEEGYVIAVQPYDAGDKITYRYIKKFDAQKLKKEIASLKGELSSGDYRVIKCYEAALVNQEAPYDIEALRSERQALRDRINELEQKLNEVGDA